jgi:hypothetical protein
MDHPEWQGHVSMQQPDAYQRMVMDYFDCLLRTPKKLSTWKHMLVTPQGARARVFPFKQPDGNVVFYIRTHDILQLILPSTPDFDHLRAGRRAPSRAEFIDEIRRNRTGNHQPRHHPVRIPTSAGAPVLG